MQRTIQQLETHLARTEAAYQDTLKEYFWALDENDQFEAGERDEELRELARQYQVTDAELRYARASAIADAADRALARGLENGSVVYAGGRA